MPSSIASLPASHVSLRVVHVFLLAFILLSLLSVIFLLVSSWFLLLGQACSIGVFAMVVDIPPPASRGHCTAELEPTTMSLSCHLSSTSYTGLPTILNLPK